MSFRCGICYIQTKPTEKATRIVVETRSVIYPIRENANVFMRSEKVGDVFVRGKKDTSDDNGGAGNEIVKEVLACESCSIIYPTLREEYEDQKYNHNYIALN